MKFGLRTKINLMFLLVILAGTIAISTFMSNVMKDKAIESAQEKLQSDLAMAKALLDEKYPGEWKILNSKIFKGNILINHNFEIVDFIGEITGDTVTVFHDDIRVSTNVKNKEGKRAIGTKVSEIVADIVLKQHEAYVGKAEVEGVWNQTIYDPIKDINGNVIGILCVGVPNTPYDNMARDFRYKTYIFGAIQALIAYFIARIFSTRLAKNIKILKSTAENIAEGNLLVSSTVNTKDEIEELSSSLNKMVNNMHELIRGISATAQNLATSSEELSSTSDENTTASEHMAKTIAEVAQGNERQAHEINEISAVAQQITASAQQLESTTNSIEAMTDNAAEATLEGGKAVEKAVQQMKNINHSTEVVNQAIKKLTLSSQQINKIANVISGIADQTNLLALNAAIEAARAGDAGRGFAVVADEVRKLAEQCLQATKQIAILVDENETNIENANKAMEDGVNDVKLGIEVANTARTSFANVEKLENEVTLQIKEILYAIQQVAAGNQNISVSVQEIAGISKQISSQTQTASAAAQEQLAIIEETAASANALASTAENLQTYIAKFRL